MALIDKDQVKAEIERLKERAAAERVLHPQTILAAKNYLLIMDYDNLLSFLDTLQEQPVEGLEEEIHEYNKERFDEYYPEQDGDFISEVDFMTCLDKVARHFAEWGAEHLKK